MAKGPTPSGSYNKIPAIVASMRQSLDAVTRAAAFNIAARAKASMTTSKSGETYRVSGRWHRASAPGQAPAVLYGTLWNSISIAHPEFGQAVVYSTDEKAPYLEFGTRRMGSRPFMAPAADDERDGYVRAVAAILKKASGV